MKKWFTAIFAAAFALCFCLGLAACGDMFGGGGNADGGSNTSGGMKEENDGTFIYSGSSVKAASTSISGEIAIPAEHNGISIDTIPARAFQGCNMITSVTVPKSVASIGGAAFSGCSSLRSITLPFVGGQKGNSDEAEACFGYIFGSTSYQNGTGIYQDYASGRTKQFYIPFSLRNVTITNETIIGKSAFEDCAMLTKIDLNDGIVQVGADSFAGCSKIEEIHLPNIQIIPASMLYGCISLRTFTIGSFVDTIGASAFSGCTALSSINSENSGEFIIPDTVNSIGGGAFSGCTMIRSITLPFIGSQRGNDSEASCFGYIYGTNSYQNGTGVYQQFASGRTRQFYIPSSLRNVTITDETLIGRAAFQNCTMLESITINASANHNVGELAFQNAVTPKWV